MFELTHKFFCMTFVYQNSFYGTQYHVVYILRGTLPFKPSLCVNLVWVLRVRMAQLNSQFKGAKATLVVGQ